MSITLEPCALHLPSLLVEKTKKNILKALVYSIVVWGHLLRINLDKLEGFVELAHDMTIIDFRDRVLVFYHGDTIGARTSPYAGATRIFAHFNNDLASLLVITRSTALAVPLAQLVRDVVSHAKF